MGAIRFLDAQLLAHPPGFMRGEDTPVVQTSPFLSQWILSIYVTYHGSQCPRETYPIEYVAVLERHRDFEENGFHCHLLVNGSTSQSGSGVVGA